jgi:hypothetical protein
VVALKASDIDSKRMMLRVEQGKGRKDRFAMLSPQLLELLRDWWRIARPPVWMFPGCDRISLVTIEPRSRAHGALREVEIKLAIGKENSHLKYRSGGVASRKIQGNIKHKSKEGESLSPTRAVSDLTTKIQGRDKCLPVRGISMSS